MTRQRLARVAHLAQHQRAVQPRRRPEQQLEHGGDARPQQRRAAPPARAATPPPGRAPRCSSAARIVGELRAQHLEVERLLRAEVVVRRRDVDAGALRDVAHRRAVEPALGEQRARRGEEPLPRSRGVPCDGDHFEQMFKTNVRCAVKRARRGPGPQRHADAADRGSGRIDGPNRDPRSQHGADSDAPDGPRSRRAACSASLRRRFYAAAAGGNLMYSSMISRARSVGGGTLAGRGGRGARRSSTRRSRIGVEREVVGVLAPGAALGLVGEAVRLPRHREAQLVPGVARDRPCRRRARSSGRRRRRRGACRAAAAPSAPSRRRRGRRRGRRCRCRAGWRCCARRQRDAAAPSAPSGIEGELAAARSRWNHDDAGGDRHAPARRTGRSGASPPSATAGYFLRLAPRNSGTSVCTASSWPGTRRLA